MSSELPRTLGCPTSFQAPRPATCAVGLAPDQWSDHPDHARTAATATATATATAETRDTVAPYPLLESAGEHPSDASALPARPRPRVMAGAHRRRRAVRRLADAPHAQAAVAADEQDRHPGRRG